MVKMKRILFFWMVVLFFLGSSCSQGLKMKAKDGKSKYEVEIEAYLDAMPGRPDVEFRSPYVVINLRLKSGDKFPENIRLKQAYLSVNEHEQSITNFDRNDFTGKGSLVYQNTLRSIDKALGDIFDVYLVFENEEEELFSLKQKEVSVQKVF